MTSGRRPPAGIINVIAGGHQPWIEEEAESFKRPKIEEPITFTEEDTQGVLYPHNDAVVVTLNIKNYDICRVLIDKIMKV